MAVSRLEKELLSAAKSVLSWHVSVLPSGWEIFGVSRLWW